MPFKSDKQRDWMYANESEMAERWSKHTSESKDLPERVGKMTSKAYFHAYYKTEQDSEERQMLRDARVIGKRMLVVEEGPLVGKAADKVHRAMKNGPMKIIAPDESMMGKHTGAEMPMIGKADEMLEAVPEAVRRLFTQMPLEMQATELGGAGATDVRPTMREMNYHVPSQHAGQCATCDHAGSTPGLLVCYALQGDPGVARNGRCDIWSGTAHKSLTGTPKLYMIGKRRDGGGPSSYYNQTMPDYQYIYNQVPNENIKKEQKDIDRRRRGNAARNSGRFGWHGEAPEPVLRHESTDYPVQIMQRPKKGQTQPTVEAPVITHKNDPESRSNRMVRMYGKRSRVAVDEMMFFSDKEAADRYCFGKDGLMPIPVDLKLAKKYGLLQEGYVVMNVDSGIFEAVG